MALVVRTIKVTLGDNTPPDTCRLPSGRSGEVIKAGPIYLNANGKWYQSNGTANNAAAKVHAWAIKDYPNIGDAIDPYVEILLPWGPSTLTPGIPLYIATTAGELDTAATTGGTTPCAYVVGIKSGGSQPHAYIRCRTVIV